jgi:hypothetical protein
MVRATLARFDSLEMLRRWIALHPSGRERASELPQMERRLESLERKFRRYMDQAARGTISLDKMRAVGKELVTERRVLVRRLALLEAAARGDLNETELEEQYLASIEEIRRRWGAMTILETKVLLQEVIERIVVYDEHVETVLRF